MVGELKEEKRGRKVFGTDFGDKMKIGRRGIIEFKKKYTKEYKKILNVIAEADLAEREEVLNCEAKNNEIEEKFLEELSKSKDFHFQDVTEDMNMNLVSLYVFYVSNQAEKWIKHHNAIWRRLLIPSDTTDFDLKVEEVKDEMLELADDDTTSVIRLYKTKFKQLKTIHKSISKFSITNFLSQLFLLFLGILLGNIDRLLSILVSIYSMGISKETLLNVLNVIAPIIMVIIGAIMGFVYSKRSNEKTKRGKKENKKLLRSQSNKS